MRRRKYLLKFYSSNPAERMRVLHFIGFRASAERAAVREVYRLRREGFDVASVGIGTSYGGNIRRTGFVTLPKRRALASAV